MALEVCTRAYVFEIGRIALSGPRAELIENPAIRRAYLGQRTADSHGGSTPNTEYRIQGWGMKSEGGVQRAKR